jgi:helicase
MKKLEYHKNITYNPLQQLTAPLTAKDCNVVVLAPTSSGKTIVAEQFIYPTLLKGLKAVYLSPLKALTSEKLKEWEKIPFSTVAITGDHQTKASGITEKLVLMTTESLDSKTRGRHGWIYKVGCLVADEAHMLGMQRRGDAFEVGLTRFTALNPEARIVFLSATMTNARELGDWLTHLNGKPTKVIETDWRPVKQEHKLIVTRARPWEFNQDVKSHIKKIKQKNPVSQILIFVHTVYAGITLAKALKCPFHYSKISKTDREKMENDFRNKKTMMMVSTSTLAYGVNLPADIGIIVGAHRGPIMVESADIKQMAGRIGRYGLSKTGKVFYIFPDYYAKEKYEELSAIPEIKSVLPYRLYFHLVSLIAREEMQRYDIEEFLSRTLAAQQHGIIDLIDESIDTLVQYKAIYEPIDGQLVTTPLGRASALMYVDPIDLYHLKINFSNNPISPTAIAQALVNVPSLEVHTTVPELDDPIEYPYGYQTLMATGLREWLRGSPLPAPCAVIVSQYVRDSGRIFSALILAGAKKDYISSIQLMVTHGVQRYLIDLVKVPGIGRKRAFSLYQHGIEKPEQIVDNNVARNILGEKTYMNVVNQIQPDGKVFFSF